MESQSKCIHTIHRCVKCLECVKKLRLLLLFEFVAKWIALTEVVAKWIALTEKFCKSGKCEEFILTTMPVQNIYILPEKTDSACPISKFV